MSVRGNRISSKGQRGSEETIPDGYRTGRHTPNLTAKKQRRKKRWPVLGERRDVGREMGSS